MSKQVGNVQLMQKMNRLRVLDFIRRNPDTSRPMIAAHTGLSLASITNVTSYLLDAGFLKESGIESVERVGRKSTLLKFCSDSYGLVVAILSDKEISVSYTTLEGVSKVSKKYSTDDMKSDKVIELAYSVIKEIVNECGAEKTLAIGVHFSGLVLDGSRFVFSSSMRWKEIDIREKLQNDMGIPVFVENISRLRAVGYACSHKDSYSKNMVFVDLENGIGAVRISNGLVKNTVLGEIGHTTVERNGIECFCGNRGCLEAMCSLERLQSLYASKSGNADATAYDITSLYYQNDDDASYAIRECSEYLGIGLANLVSIFHPSVLVINRGQFEHCSPLISEAVDEMNRRAYNALIQDMEVRYISIDFKQTLKGAAYEMCDRIFDISFPHNPIV